MSGTFDVVTQVAKKYPNVAVIDSRTNSGAQGLLVQYAGELIKAQHSFQSIMTAIEKAISETSIFVIVNEFESMVRSGRINTIAGQMARLSGIKPIISIDKTGKGSLYSSAFSTRSALSKLIKIIEQVRRRPGKELAEYCIVHAGVEEKANDFAKLTTKALQKPPAYIEDVSAVIGLHAGQGCIALAARMRSTKDAS
jgi:DegV family protein with EDD domain